MKILIFAPGSFTGSGGIQVFTNYLVRVLLECGHNLSVISALDRKIPDRVRFAFVPCGKYKYFRKILLILNGFYQALNFKPDLIICIHVNYSVLAFILSKITGVPYFTVAHGVEVWAPKKEKLLGLKCSNKILAVSNFTKNRILEEIPEYQEKNVFILHNTFDEEVFIPKSKPQYLIDRWKIKKNEKIILTVSRLSRSDSDKGYDKILGVIDNISRVVPDVKYILCGGGDDLERLKDTVKGLRLEDRIIFPGHVPDNELVDYYNLCDLFVLPSVQEGFGIVFLEALACGKPVIAGNRDGSVDAVLNGSIGLLVDPHDSKQIESAIIKVLTGEAPAELLDCARLRREVIKAYGLSKFKETVKESLRL